MTPSSTRTPITVVVPIYGDLPSLLECLDSLTRTIDFDVDRVLLVNDSGPQADVIEDALKPLIADQPGFSYFRNERNLGFVGTCNRAAFELDQTDNDLLFLNSDTVTTPGFTDELSGVLHSSSSHGAVCPRSNNATIASFPYALRDPAVGRTPERTAEVHALLRETLPRFTVAPVAMGFCILIRRELITEFGLFDETFAPGYGEENDFCLRIGEHGYVSVISHHALVFHLTGKSFTGVRRTRLRASHERILVSRYPSYPNAVRDYLYLRRDPVDVFADALALPPGETTTKILLDLDWAPGEPASAWHTAILSAAGSDAQGRAVTVAVPDADVARIAALHPAVTVEAQSRLTGIWDIAFGSSTRSRSSQLARMNRCALRWVVDETIELDTDRYDARVADSTATTAAELVAALGTDWAHSSVDVARLRNRWTAITASPDREPGGTVPAAPRGVTGLRRIAARLPARLDWLVAIARVVARRD